MLKADTVIFDLDGTLLDTGEGIFASLKAVLDRFGIDYRAEDLQAMIGPPMYESLTGRLGLSGEKAMEIIAVYREIYRSEGTAGYSHYPGVPQLLRRLRLSGKKLYVATNKVEQIAKDMLNHAGLGELFDGVFGAGEFDRASNKAESIRRILKLSGSERAVMVGDRAGDVQAAKEASIPCVFAGWGYGSKAESEAGGADFFAESARAAAGLLGVSGLFVTYEGGDGAGKTTQIDLLAEYLKSRGEQILRTFEPGGCSISNKIREILLDNANSGMEPVTEALLYAAARAQHVRQVIIPALDAGKIVVSDRYLDSSVAYQGFGRGLGAETVLDANKLAVSGVIPHRTYYLRGDPKRLSTRRKEVPDRIESENDSFKERVEQGFWEVREANPERVLMLDAACPAEETFDIIKSDIDSLLF